jgi:Protein of unknown function (DUF1592)/Protein of unknown function (DUF1588)/Protein of unknown function (DUF1587)/Protein of unknown function (DUF1595)/Protein of unknown function (DUF1585)/Ca-dependent carbohydrate-binding module xylan-binding
MYMLRIICLLSLVFCLLTNQSRAQNANRPIANATAQLNYKNDIQPLLKKYCYDCHSGTDPEGKLVFDKLDPAGGRKVRPQWQKIHDYIEGTLMPPDDATQPTSAERTQLAAWLKTNPLHLDCSGATFPGRVTSRRLNRVEYNNTVRDLCEIDFQPANDFPSDDIGHGFDNNADVLSLPPLLMEKYLTAAKQISEKAILAFTPENAPVTRRNEATLSSTGKEVLTHTIAQTGELQINVVVAADQAGPDKARIRILWNDEQLSEVDIPGKNNKESSTFKFTKKAKAGKHTLTVEFLNDYYNENDKDPKQRGDRNVLIRTMEVLGPIGGKPDKLPKSHTAIIFKEPSENLSHGDCAEQIMKRFASRAYRRPVTSDELKRLTKIYELARSSGDSFEQGIQLCMQAVLASPYFLFRIEQDPTSSDAQGIRTLNEYELASRLSYFLWSTMPDAELLALAHAGKLRAELPNQVKRMLTHERATALVNNFAGQWLQLRSLERSSPSTRAFPQWNTELRTAMQQETELFFQHIVKEDKNVTEFLTANYTFLNEPLAKHYGISGVSGKEFRQVKLDTPQRGGLLGHASILTVTSNPARTSPVKRGKWILENLLAAPPPPAPPNVPALDEAKQVASAASLRKRLEMHRANPSCNACHKLLDPLGFALENYDAIGAWRTRDGKFEIDPTGELPSGEKLKGVQELRDVLVKREDAFRRCLTEKLFLYALGRGLELDDQCTIERIATTSKQQGGKFSTIVLGIIQSDQFQKRATTRTPIIK